MCLPMSNERPINAEVGPIFVKTTFIAWGMDQWESLIKIFTLKLMQIRVKTSMTILNLPIYHHQDQSNVLIVHVELWSIICFPSSFDHPQQIYKAAIYWSHTGKQMNKTERDHMVQGILNESSVYMWFCHTEGSAVAKQESSLICSITTFKKKPRKCC